MTNYNHFDNEYFMRIIQKENKSAYLYLEINVPWSHTHTALYKKSNCISEIKIK